MFFDQSDWKIDIRSVHALSWDDSAGIADDRPFHALSFRRHGNADFVTENGSFHATDGDILYVPKGCGYTLSAKNEELFVVHFDLLNSAKLPLSRIERLSPNDAEYYDNRFSRLCKLWTKKQSGYRYDCAAVLYKLLASLHREACENRGNDAGDKLIECVDYIHEHFTDRELSITYLSGMAGMSDTYFRKLFVSSFGTTPLRYINNLRIAHAVELLRSGYYSVEQVAEKAGFDNPKYLCTILRKSTGYTPLDFKNGKAPSDLFF